MAKGAGGGGRGGRAGGRETTFRGRPISELEELAKQSFTNPRIDIPTGIHYKGIEKEVLNMAEQMPSHLGIAREARGQTHTGRGTAWAGSYDTWVVYDKLDPEWATTAAEQWGVILHQTVIEAVGGRHRTGTSAKYI